jgi:hypothetical protein
VSADGPKFTVSQPVITFALGVISLTGVLFTVVTWVNDRVHYEQTTSAEIVELKEADIAQVQANKELSGEIGNLSTAVNDLALTLKEVEVIQRNSPLTGQIPETVLPRLNAHQ